MMPILPPDTGLNSMTMLRRTKKLVRHWHHVMMWFFVVFSIVHVYLVFYHDYVEGRGVTSSMVGGWKFIEKTKYCRSPRPSLSLVWATS